MEEPSENNVKDLIVRGPTKGERGAKKFGNLSGAGWPKIIKGTSVPAPGKGKQNWRRTKLEHMRTSQTCQKDPENSGRSEGHLGQKVQSQETGDS